MRKNFLSTAILFLSYCCTYGQISTEEYPTSFGRNIPALPINGNTHKILPSLDMNTIEQEDADDETNGIPPRFGYRHEVNYSLEQAETKNLIGAHVALGSGFFSNNKVISFSREPIKYDKKYYYSIGLDYSRILSRHWDFCSGFEYTRSKIIASSDNTWTGHDQAKIILTLATIPAQFKYHFRNWIFINGGLLFNVLARLKSIPVDNWGGDNRKTATHKLNMFLGIQLGIGFQYEVARGIILTLNPSFRWNGIENAGKEGEFLKFLQAPGKRIIGSQFTQIGVNLGIGYKL